MTTNPKSKCPRCGQSTGMPFHTCVVKAAFKLDEVAEKVQNDFWKKEQQRVSLLKSLLEKVLEYHCPKCSEPFKGELTILHKSKHDDIIKELVKLAVQEYATDLHQSLTKQNEELAKVKANHNYFVSSMAGSFYGLLTHPSDIPLNGCLISEPSKEKMREVYRQVLKEKQAIDSAIAAQEKMK